MIDFDAIPIRTRIAADLIARLSVLSIEQGGYVRAIEQVPIALEKVDQEPFQHAMHAVVGRSPAILLALDDYGNFEAHGTSQTNWRSQLDVHIYAISTHRRDLLEGREDSDGGASRGLRALTEHIGRLLSGYEPDIEYIEPLMPLRLQGLWADAAMTVWEWRFRLWHTFAAVTEPMPQITSVRMRQIGKVDKDETALVLEQQLESES